MTWSIEERAQVRLDRIKQEIQQDGIMRMVLATDPDREGEAIAWHLQDVLQVSFCLLVCSSASMSSWVCVLSAALHFQTLSALLPLFHSARWIAPTTWILLLPCQEKACMVVAATHQSAVKELLT